MPCACSRGPGPMPESCRICGEPMAPAARMTSRRAESRSPRHQLYPRRARPPVARLDRDAPHLGAGPHGQVRPVHDRPQVRLGAAPAPAAALVHLEVGVAEVVAPVELGDLGNAALLGRVAPRVEDLPAHPALLDPHLAADPVALVGAVLVVLRPHEHRQHVVPAPAAVAERRPVVVVAALPPHVDHRVDRRAAAEDPAAGVQDGPAVQPGVGARCGNTSRCEGCRSYRGSRRGCRSRSSRPCPPPRAAARWRPGRPTAGWRARSRRCPRRR